MARRAWKSSVIEWPKGSGIRIRTTRNRKKVEGVLKDFGKAFIVNLPAKLAGKRSRPQFTTLAKAKGRAEQLYAKSKEEGFRAFAMKPGDREDAARALEKIAKASLKMSLLQVVEFAIPHLAPAGGRKKLKDVIKELGDSKQRRYDKKAISKRTVDSFRSLQNLYLEDLGEKWVDEVTKDDVFALLTDVAEENAARTVKNYRVFGAEVFKHACQKRYLTTSPIFYITKEEMKELEEKADKSRQPSVLTPEEAHRLLECAFAHPELKLHGALTLILLGGVRTQEAQVLDWKDVHLDRDVPFVCVGPDIAKKRRIRNIELEPFAVETLKRIADRTGLVAGSKADGWYTKRFTKLCRKAGFHVRDDDGKWVSEWENNAMRHSFGTYHFALHGDSVLTSRLMGHKQGDDVLFSHYRALADKSAGKQYFKTKEDAPAPQLQGQFVPLLSAELEAEVHEIAMDVSGGFSSQAVEAMKYVLRTDPVYLEDQRRRHAKRSALIA